MQCFVVEIREPVVMSFRQTNWSGLGMVLALETLAMFVAPGGVPVLFDHVSVSQLIGERNTAA